MSRPRNPQKPHNVTPLRASADNADSAEVPTTARRASPGRYLTIADVCADLGISRSTFYDWRAKRKAPPCLKLPNGDLRIRRTDYERWLSALTEEAA
jgi:predicted DNA-binding transcriptional regulator AlpA